MKYIYIITCSLILLMTSCSEYKIKKYISIIEDRDDIVFVSISNPDSIYSPYDAFLATKQAYMLNLSLAENIFLRHNIDNNMLDSALTILNNDFDVFTDDFPDITNIDNHKYPKNTLSRKVEYVIDEIVHYNTLYLNGSNIQYSNDDIFELRASIIKLRYDSKRLKSNIESAKYFNSN